MRADRVHRVTMTLEGLDTKRVVDVPDIATLTALHDVVLAAMGWSGGLPHAWLVDGREVAASLEQDWLSGALVGRRCEYRYGAWTLSIHVAPGQRPSALPYPMLLQAEAAAPPEECGGPEAYRRALAGDPECPLPEGFDPKRAELRAASARVAALQ